MQKMTRKEFLSILSRFGLVAGAAAVIGPVIAYFFPAKLEEMPSEPVLVGDQDSLPVGSGKTVRFGRYPALVIHTPSGLKAYSAVCTHFACVCKWDSEKELIVCPCHDGFFNPEDGSVISGPPPNGLMVLPVNVKDGQIYVGG